MALSDEKIDIQLEEHATEARGVITPEEIQARFETLRDLSKEEMDALNKRVVKIMDWRLMPCITVMFLMSYVH